MQIKPLTKRDIEMVANLHLKTLLDISALLGFPYVKKMYTLILNDSINHYSLGAWKGKKLIGFVIVSMNMTKTHNLFHQLFSFRTFYDLFFHIITFKVSPIRLIKRIFFESKLNSLIGENYYCLGPICVNKKYQRKGIGKLLLKSIIEYVNKLKVDTLYAYTRSDNYAAFSFYKKMGFKILGVFYDGILLGHTNNVNSSQKRN